MAFPIIVKTLQQHHEYFVIIYSIGLNFPAYNTIEINIIN